MVADWQVPVEVRFERLALLVCQTPSGRAGSPRASRRRPRGRWICTLECLNIYLSSYLPFAHSARPTMGYGGCCLVTLSWHSSRSCLLLPRSRSTHCTANVFWLPRSMGWLSEGVKEPAIKLGQVETKIVRQISGAGTFVEAKVVARHDHSSSTILLRLQLTTPNTFIDIPPAHHISLRALMISRRDDQSTNN
ncbi:hypothetical protein BJ742DRAFT_323213 [Cladochytrium replicatum]|nr:hypothetical protein BJ742DRAFT_323213 [Cladochytrium replicatum]